MTTKIFKLYMRNEVGLVYHYNNFMEQSGINYSLSIPSNFSSNRLFVIQISANPIDKLPVKTKVRITVENRSNSKAVEKDIIFISEAPTHKLFFGKFQSYYEFTFTVYLETTILNDIFPETLIRNSIPTNVSINHTKTNSVQDTNPSMANTQNDIHDSFVNSSKNKDTPNDINPFHNDKKSLSGDIPTQDQVSDLPNLTYNGIRNLGSTCYLNSIIQTLFLLSQFRKFIYDASIENIENKEKSVLYNLKNLFYELQTSQFPCNSTTFCLAFTRPNFKVNRHQDAHEFLKLLLSSIEKEQSNLKQPIESLFQGKIVINTLDKDTLAILSQKSEETSDISIDLHKTLNKSLRYFTHKSELNDESDHLTQSFITELPKVLVIHLKRYEVDPKYPDLILKKCDSLEYDENIDLKELVSEDKRNQPTKYRLFSIVAHIGMIESGHYKMFCQPEMDGNWYEFNDSIVTQCTKEQAIRGNFGAQYEMTAYLLFYIREDSINEVFSKTNLVIPQQVVTEITTTNIEPESINDVSYYKYTKYISTIDSFRWNCINGIPGFLNNAKALQVDFTNLTNSDLYNNISEQLKTSPNCIRLWSCKNDIFDSIIPNDSTSCEKLKHLNLFVQMKLENEPLKISRNSRIYFLKVYTPGLQTPFFSLDIHETHCNDYSDTISAKTIINENKKYLSSEIPEYNYDLYIENRLKLKYLIYSEKISNGAVLVLCAKRFYFTPNDIQRTMKKMGLHYDIENYKNIDKFPPSYYDLVDPEIPEEITLYYEKQSNLKKVPLCNYEDIDTKLFDIEFPISISYDELINYVGKIIQFDSKQTLRLFSNNPCQTNIPSQFPLGSEIAERHDYSNSSYRHSSSSIRTVERIYYYLDKKKASDTYSFDLPQTRIVHLSRDGHTVDKKLALFLSDKATFNDILSKCDSSFTRNLNEIRVYSISNQGKLSDIISKLDYSISIVKSDQIIRIDIIPYDQRGSDVTLMKVYPTMKNGYLYQVFDTGFYMKYIENEKISDFEKRLLKFTNSTDSMQKLSFYSSYPYSFSKPNTTITLDYKKELYVVYDFNDDDI